jgi:ketosteroid isomerase-like protein
VSFVAAFDRGDLARLDALFAPGTSFEWYSSNAPGLRVSEAARNRDSLRAYFRRRHLVHDRLRLVSFVFTGNSSGYGNAAFTMRRAASDYRRGDWFRLSGKAAARCSGKASVQFIVLSLGGPGSA